MLNIIHSWKQRNNATTIYGFLAFATLIIIVALPAVTFLFPDSNFLWEFGSVLLPKRHGNTSSQQHEHHGRADNNNNRSTYFAAEISPNLTSCHDSYGRPDLLINCCPPLPGVNDVAVEFRFPDPSKSPRRVRRPLHRASAEYLAKYTKALRIMKSLPHSDPRSFSRQAIIHCTFCSGAYDMKSYLDSVYDGAGDSPNGYEL